ncbi:hypothetical protein IMSAGC008_01332 [Muribaculaceae bacterium]|nr:hypothetical protein IMSAGC008_01332 [Muribaculaceae bacterium]
MRLQKLQNISRALLLIFAFFYCGNTLFIHSHRLLDGERVVHSHPYLPGGQHSHSPEALTGLALLNAAFGAMVGAKSPIIRKPHLSSSKICAAYSALLTYAQAIRTAGRAPPASDF